MKTHAYQVAGFRFCIESPETLPLPEGLENFLPFQSRDKKDPLFTLRVVDDLPRTELTPLFQSEDGPGFPQISLYSCDGGYCFQTRSLPGRPVHSTLLVDDRFRQAQIKLEGLEDATALNNALMLLFTFASARKGVLEMHASVVMQDGKGYLFLGRSGTGKSTHSSLWLRYIPGTELLNDDNPVLRLMPDGTVRVYGSPWSGKTPCYKAMDVPVGAIVRLAQAPENRIVRLSGVQAYASLMASASGFRPFRELADGWHRTLEGIVRQTPCYQLDCLPDRAAAELCYKTVHG